MKKRRFSEQDWIALGLAELSAKGCDAIKLEAICKAAGLTRGSFYHHFADHESFLTGLARHWLKAQTEDVAAVLDAAASAHERSDALTEAAMSIDYRLELGMRELARRLPSVREIVRQADARRLEIVSTLYQESYGLDAEHAYRFAYLEYAAFSGIILLDPDIPAEQQHDLAKLFERTVARALSSDFQQRDAAWPSLPDDVFD
ncbi:MAG: TetR/AcrR family transcriptional regulator [Pseudomonadota bacterium]